MRRFAIILLFSASLILMGCEKSDAPEFETRLVLDAWIDSDGYPVAILTHTISPSSEDVYIADAIVRWGKVTLSDGVNEIKLTGGPDGLYFPPYVYKSFYMQGVPGRTYTITATDGKQTVTATSTMLPPPAIKSVEVSKIEETDSLWRATLNFMPATDEEAYFVAFVRVNNAERFQSEMQYFPAFLGNVVTRSNDPVSIALYQGKHRDTKLEYYNNFHTGDHIDVLLCRVDRVAYNFWGDYFNAVYFENGIFVSTLTPLHGNVEAADALSLPGYGLFSARGTAKYSLKIE